MRSQSTRVDTSACSANDSPPSDSIILTVSAAPSSLISMTAMRAPCRPNALHGGAVAALLARAAEQHDPGAANFVTRLTVELFRPVPLGRLVVQAPTVRPGRRVQWIDIALRTDDGKVVAGAHALRVE